MSNQETLQNKDELLYEAKGVRQQRSGAKSTKESILYDFARSSVVARTLLIPF